MSKRENASWKIVFGNDNHIKKRIDDWIKMLMGKI